MSETVTDLLWVLGRVILLMGTLILLTRLNGLRSFSKMSSFDFAVTVAFGSILASSLTSPDGSVWVGVTALAGLFGYQYVLSHFRMHSDRVEQMVGNTPLLIMEGPEILWDNMHRAQITEADLYAKLREANVLTFDQIRAVVAENTGDISVLHGDADGAAFDRSLLKGVAQDVG